VILVETSGPSHGTLRKDSIGLVRLKPGPLCPEAGYDYQIIAVTSPVTVVARAPGTFAPGFLWSVGGTRVHRGTQQVTVPVRVVDTRPGKGEPVQDGVPLRLQCTVKDFATTSQLDVVNLDFPGNVDGIEVKAVLTEQAVTVIPGKISATTTIAPRMRSYAMSWQYYQDVERCNPSALWQAAVDRNALLAKIFDIKNRPDPPPPEVLADLVAAAVRYAAATEELTRTAPNVTGTTDELLPSVAESLVVADAAEEVELAGRVFRSVPVAAAPPTE
jgi:hypothetical protein